MQLLHKHQPTILLREMAQSAREGSAHNFEVKEKGSSNASLMLMNPVASGDNMTINLNTQKIKEDLPPLVPCCEGRELQDIFDNCLSAISVKHDDNVIHSASMSCACERMQVPPGIVKHRNSFRSLHRPDLKRVPYLRRMTAEELETLFLGYADIHNHIKLGSRTTPQPDTTDGRRKDELKSTTVPDEGTLHPIPEIHSGVNEIPAGMRLHGARARLYTSKSVG
ncbi:unnamed protein product [Leptidea sinapis]|uniref:Uncharacterized protein n=1 Tax=Leptidea sinapis TaxID=189913 RepID=A0A5E4QAC7_9NEOP|nr:unnamed protein product [Leptidea sinapis]